MLDIPENKTPIIAVDFDGTLVENKFPDIGEPRIELINALKNFREHGGKLILFTCRTGVNLEKALKVCKDHSLVFDAINENLPEVIEYMGGDSRKIVADLYIDDRAIPPITIYCDNGNDVFAQIDRLTPVNWPEFLGHENVFENYLI